MVLRDASASKNSTNLYRAVVFPAPSRPVTRGADECALLSSAPSSSTSPSLSSSHVYHPPTCDKRCKWTRTALITFTTTITIIIFIIIVVNVIITSSWSPADHHHYRQPHHHYHYFPHRYHQHRRHCHYYIFNTHWSSPPLPSSSLFSSSISSYLSSLSSHLDHPPIITTWKSSPLTEGRASSRAEVLWGWLESWWRQ